MPIETRACLGVILGAVLASHVALAHAKESLCPQADVHVVPENPCGDLPAEPSGSAAQGDTISGFDVVIPETWIPGAFLVRVRAAHTADEIVAAVTGAATLALNSRKRIVPKVRQLAMKDVFEIRIDSLTDAGVARDFLRQLARVSDQETGKTLFVSVEPVFEAYNQSSPNDTAYVAGHQWGLDRIEAPAAWSLLRPDDVDVLVAVVDSGAWYGQRTDEASTPRYDFADLEARLWSDPTLRGPDGLPGTGHGANLVAKPPTGDSQDAAGHGTQVATIVGAVTNNAYGIAGTTGPAARVRLVPVKVMEPESNPMFVSGTTSDIVDGIGYASNVSGVGVINLSLGSAYKSPAMCEAIRRAGDKGIVVVAAAGNAGLDNDTSPLATRPASYPLGNIVSVMGTAEGDALMTGKSNFGCTSVDIAAPGAHVATMSRDAKPDSPSGTSMAAPFVSAAAALVKSMNPAWTPAQIRAHLVDTADRFKVMNAANGRLNLRKALTSPVRFDASGVPSRWTAGSTVSVAWKETLRSRACPTIHLWLLPDGSTAAHDDCDDPATCRVLATSIAAASKLASVSVPQIAATAARLRIGCDGGGLFDESGPIAVGP